MNALMALSWCFITSSMPVISRILRNAQSRKLSSCTVQMLFKIRILHDHTLPQKTVVWLSETNIPQCIGCNPISVSQVVSQASQVHPKEKTRWVGLKVKCDT